MGIDGRGFQELAALAMVGLACVFLIITPALAAGISWGVYRIFTGESSSGAFWMGAIVGYTPSVALVVSILWHLYKVNRDG